MVLMDIESPNIPISKPVILYRCPPVVNVGGRAFLTKTNHYSDWSRGMVTSTVLSFDEGTGRIETQNTIYLPEIAP